MCFLKNIFGSKAQPPQDLAQLFGKLGGQREIDNLFDQFAIKAGFILSRLQDPLGDIKNLRVKNPIAYNQLKNLAATFHDSFILILDELLTKAAEASEQKNDSIIYKIIKTSGIVIAADRLLKYFNRKDPGIGEISIDNIRTLARNQFERRTLKLSPKVWKISKQTIEQVEQYVSSGLSTGQSAAKISLDVRQYLKNPDARFRRVRDPETGELKPSKPMANYHPGQGIYRSAYKNALRLARNEVNISYRMADHYRWKSIDFITGFEVKLSASHKIEDICDYMVGEYPKTFIFSGFHPQCFCISTPITPTKEEFVEYIKTDKLPGKPVKGIPPKAFNYIRDNSHKINNLKSKPFFIDDNFTLRNGVFYPNKGIYYSLNF